LKSVGIPPLSDQNAWADVWYYELGMNVFPADTKNKRTYIKWGKWQDAPLPEEQFEEWKRTKAFANGMAIIPGKAWRGPHKDKYLIFIDCDNSKAIEEFCTRNGVKVPLEEISQKFIVEQHLDNPDKAHIYFYSEIPLPKRSSDLNNPEFKPEEQPAFEVKGEGSHGIAYATPSLHKGGHPYQIIGTTEPMALNKSEAEGMKLHLDAICKKYKLKYLENDDGNGKALIPMSELKKPGFVIYEGNNRHEALMRYMESQIKTKYGRWTWSEFKQDGYCWNQICCKPPLDDKEFERQWDSACNFIIPKVEAELDGNKPLPSPSTPAATYQPLKEEEGGGEEEEREEQREGLRTVSEKLSQPEIPAAFRNDYFEYLVVQAQKTVKEENALIRQIHLTELSAYSDDPNNLGVLAPTATGKSYPIMQCIKFTPGGKEIRIVGSMTPKVLVRERGVLVDKDRKPIARQVKKLKAQIKIANSKKQYNDVALLQEQLEKLLEDSAYILELSNMTLIFLEPPHPELWALLKPILSHDYWEIEHPFVDNVGRGLEVKRVITQGWPACIFCSARDESKWEIWPEIESRFMIQSPNMIKAKYEKGNELIAIKKWQPRGVKQQLIISDKDLQLGKDCFLYLKHQILQYKQKTDSPVWAPFGELVGQIFPSDKGQDNRAFNRFASILNIITLCKAHLRYKVLYDDEELVIPSLRDLQETLHVMQNMSGLPPHKLKFYKDYILPLWKEYNGVPLQTKQICDYYNAQNPNSKLKMNSDNLRKNYLQELVNHNYLEQDQDTNTKTPKYLFTPLVLDEGTEEKEDGNSTKASQKKQLTTAPTLEQVFNKLQFSKLLLPKNHTGIPKDWLKQQILQLSYRRLTDAQLKIISPEGQEVSIDDFIAEYENDQKLHYFFSTPRLVGDSDSVKIPSSEGSNKENKEKSTTNRSEEYKKLKTQPKVGQVDEIDERMNGEI
jgi:hypothetical protein